MRENSIVRRRALALFVACGVSIGLVACAASANNQANAPSSFLGLSPDPNDVPADTTDYSDDAGNNMPEYEYDAEPVPDAGVMATLCNLNQAYFLGLRTEKSGTPVVDDALRTNLVGLGDLIAEWQNLRVHVPSAVPDIEVAEAVHEKWDEALILTENSDLREAQLAMNDAEELLSELPKMKPKYCTP